jgi:hypothetical protein
MANPLSDFRSQSTSGVPQPAVDAAPAAENPYQSPGVLEPPEIEVDQEAAISPLESQIAVLMHQGKNGAKWFYWIAGLSVVNSLLMIFGGGFVLVFGLGATFVGGVAAEVVAQQAPQNSEIVRAISFGFTLFMALICCGFGWLANKRWQPLYFIGMGLYLLDGLLFLPFGMWMSTAFHAYALYGMWGGFRAYRQLAALEKQLMDPQHPVGEFNPHQPVPMDAT